MLVVLVHLVFLEELAHLRVVEFRHVRDAILLDLVPQRIVHVGRYLRRLAGLELTKPLSAALEKTLTLESLSSKKSHT